MLWNKSDDFTIDGSPMLGTAEEQELSFSDLDSSDSGRDEAGYMHREVVREKVGTWSFQYPLLDKEDYHYLRTLLQGKPQLYLWLPGRGRHPPYHNRLLQQIRHRCQKPPDRNV